MRLKRIISKETSRKIKNILRKVVTDEKGTASLADIYGYNVSGKTGTSQYYDDKSKNIIHLYHFLRSLIKNYTLLVMLDDPKVAKNLNLQLQRHENQRNSRNEAGWNAVYSSGKIIKKLDLF